MWRSVPKEQTIDRVRRTLIKGIIAIGSIASTGRVSAETNRDQEGPSATGSLSGTIVDTDGNGVSNARVWTYRSNDQILLGETTTDSDGRFAVASLGSPVFLIVKSDDWFLSLGLSGETRDLGRLMLDQQLLYGPTEIFTNDGSSTLGVLTFWRTLTGDSPFEEQFYQLEITNVNRTSSADFPWEVDGDEWDLYRGLFVLSVPESGVMVDYGRQSPDIDMVSDAVPGITTSSRRTLPAEDGPSVVTKIHPLRDDTPNLPILPRVAGGYDLLTESDIENAETVREGQGRILETLPVVGTLVSIIDAIAWGFGGVFDKSGSAGTTSFEPLDPNVYDSIVQAWRSTALEYGESYQESTVVFSVPIRFDIDPGETVTLRAQAEWNTGRRVSDLLGEFGLEVDVGPVGTTNQPLTNELVIISTGAERCFYEITVSGRAALGDEADPQGTYPDSVSGQRIQGSAAERGRDSFRFSGSITAISLEGPAQILVNGDPVDPDDFTDDNESDRREVIIVSTATERAFYEFSVSGTVTPGEDADLEGARYPDEISGTTVTGSLAQLGRDNFYFFGEITNFELEGPADVFVDGQQVDPGAF
jgi:hypothetical protein